ncbi:stilbene synthase [Kitasatospora sp. MMS16-BH015]|uniref:type III polyketide synthase n=1 Tax=Kitasatospora sp. MMS16-BH015 TaxID=2018025 RepID=UPI000CA12B4E|nr:3-oxoacyl-[acyl-carrier-protein] synthase III C-terminal domain-containing protein [Kitasatospora sp. MMS16-BH015]AUG75108.1 stilbene synthase [Kitasatospora sp. MMS16-BH015]
MTRIAAVHGVLPPHRYEQRELTRALAGLCLPENGSGSRSRGGTGAERALLARLHAAAGVEARHLVLPIEEYARVRGFGQANDLYLEHGSELAEKALTGALAAAGVAAEQVDLVVSTSVTGIAAPSLEARLAARIGLRPDVRRLPLFGLGCAGGAAGLAALHEHLSGHPEQTAVLLSVELCSLTLQRGDTSPAGLIASALFGDGAAALVAVGDRVAVGSGMAVGGQVGGGGTRVVAARSRLYPGTEQALGWQVGDTGFRIVLGAELPELAGLHVVEEIESFLAGHDLKPGELAAWICHPGGPKVLDALAEGLGLADNCLAPSRRSLAEVGNLSSASVLHILRDTLAQGPPPPGSAGLMVALGPGFSSELVLLGW